MNANITLFSLLMLASTQLLSLGLTLKLATIMRAAAGGHAASSAGPAVGSMVPAFEGRKLANHQHVSLDSQRGRKVILVFLSSACGECRSKLARLVVVFRRAEQIGVTMWIVSLDSERNTRAFLGAHRLTAGVILPRTRSRRIFNPRRATPMYMFIDESMVLQARGTVGDAHWNSMEANVESAVGAATPTANPDLA